MKTSLLISNVAPEDAGATASGRIENVTTQGRFLRDYGWNQVVGKISRGRYLPRGIVHCLRVGRTHDIDLVHSISEPIHLHVAGLIISRLLGVPWVAHTRDSMTVNKPGLDPDSLHGRLRKRIERLVVTRADRVLWDEYGGMIPDDYFERTYPDVDPATFVKLPPIGFVAETFEAAPTDPIEGSSITYAGRFYESLEPYEFLDGLAAYVDRTGDDSVRFHIYGGWEETYQKYCADRGIADLIEPHEWVTHEELLPKLKGSDVLLHIGGSKAGHESHIGSKFYDYIGSRSPILVVGDPSFEVSTVVEDYDLGMAVTGNDAAAIADALEVLFSEGYSFDPDPKIYQQFSREPRVERLASVFDALV